MSFTKSCLALTLGTLASLASAHARLTSSSPAEGATVASPARAVLSFSEAAIITRASIAQEGAAPQELTDLPTVPAARVTLSLPKLRAGKYTLTWRVMGDDGHVLTGTLHFVVADSPAPAVQGPGK